MAHSSDSIGQGQQLATRFVDSIKRADVALAGRGRWVHASCLLSFGDESVLLDVDAGRLTVTDPVPLMRISDFSIQGTAAAWRALWKAMPPPGWHDLFALAKRGEIRIEGNLHPFLANLQYFKDVLTLPRMDAHDGSV